MVRTAAVTLSSQERCRKAFEKWANQVEPRMDNRQKATLAFAWDACWNYLETRVTEFVKS